VISVSEPGRGTKTAQRLVFVGPDPRTTPSGHAGGQLTAAIGIAGYAASHGHELHVIDTFIDSLARPSLGLRIRAGVRRVAAMWQLGLARKVDGAILFVGARHSFFERVLIAAVARAFGVSTVFCIRDGAFTGWMQGSRLLRWLVPVLLRIPHRIVVQGSRFRQVLVNAGVPPGKISVVRNWLPASFEIASSGRSASAGSPLRCVYLGWLVKEKGLRELIDACAQLSAQYSFELDLIGGGSLETELRETVAAHGLGGVRFLGWLSPAEIRQRLDRAQLLVLPSYFEGFPNALLEAMACGLPAVCTDVGAIAESVKEGVNGYLVPPADPLALAAALEHYLESPRLVELHGTAAIRLVRSLHDRETNLAQLFSCL